MAAIDFTTTVEEVITAVSRDVRGVLNPNFDSTAATDTILLVDYANRVELDLLRHSRWTWLLSDPVSFTTVPTPTGQQTEQNNSYYVGPPGILQVSDTFNRGNQNPVSGNWVAWGAFNRPQLLSNQLSPHLANNVFDVALYNATWPDDQFVQAEVRALGIGQGYLSLVLRADPAGLNMYYIDLDASPGFGGAGLQGLTPVNVQKVVGGVFGLQKQLGYTTVQIGDVFKAIIQGTTIAVFQNDQLIGTFTDTNNPILTGSGGLQLQTVPSTSSVNQLAWDNFLGGGLGDQQPILAIDTGLHLLDFDIIKKDTVIDYTNFKRLATSELEPVAQEFLLPAKPRIWQNLSSEPFVITLWPAPDMEYQISFRYYKVREQLTSTAQIVQVPDRYKDIVIAGVSYYASAYLKEQEDAARFQQLYERGKVQMIKDSNFFPGAENMVRPDPSAVTRQTTTGVGLDSGLETSIP